MRESRNVVGKENGARCAREARAIQVEPLED